MTSRLKPIGGRILVEAIAENEKEGRNHHPDTAKEKPIESLVVALGTGKMDDKGNKIPFEVNAGDRVLLARAARKSNGTGRNIESSTPTTPSRSLNDWQFQNRKRSYLWQRSN